MKDACEKEKLAISLSENEQMDQVRENMQKD